MGVSHYLTTMNATYLSTQAYPSNQYIEFSIIAARDGKNKELNQIYHSLHPVLSLSYGNIFRRSDNGNLWHVDQDNTMARRITEEQLQLFERWDARSLLPGDMLFNKLAAIGGLPSGEYYLSPDFIQFPCKIKKATGEIIDLCLLHFSVAPPYQTYFKNILLLDDIIDIEPSELALSHDLRMESMLADEIRMSFYPFTVKPITGDLLLYNGRTHFVSKGEVKGNDIQHQVPFSHEAKYRVVDVPFDDITYVIGKWDERFNTLFAQYREILYNKKPTMHVRKNEVERTSGKNIFTKLWNWFRSK